MDSSNPNMRAPVEASRGEDTDFITAVNLASGSVVPMALRFAIELNLLQFISDAAEAGASPSELAAKISARNPDAADMIDRVLRLLTTNSVLTCTLPRGGGERRYSAAPVCKYFTRDDKMSVVHFTLLVQDKVLVDTWYHSKDAVLEGGTSFERACGMHLFEYLPTDSRLNDIYNKGIYERSFIDMKKIMDNYGGFEGLKTLVDVGGGKGASLEMIIAKYPSIRGINFDLPHVIQDAQSIPGVKHIGGDMFVSVPRADAIFLKTICHDWSDAHVVKLLKNCYEALPENGKLIVGDIILPEHPSNRSNESWAVQSNVLMMMFNPGGKERTEMEFRTLAAKAGFNRFLNACHSDVMSILEFYK